MFATRLKELRLSQNLTQAELAEKLSLKPSIIGMYENDRRMPETKTLSLIAEIFDVSTDYLLDRTNIKEYFRSENLKYLRGNKSIDDYAKALNISKDLLIRYEEGKEIPTKSIIEYIAELEGIHLSYFFEASRNLDNLKKQNKLSYTEPYNNDLKEWLLTPDSKDYIEFIYKVYKQGFTKEMLSNAVINVKIN